MARAYRLEATMDDIARATADGLMHDAKGAAGDQAVNHLKSCAPRCPELPSGMGNHRTTLKVVPPEALSSHQGLGITDLCATGLATAP